MEPTWEARCRNCRATFVLDLARRIEWLRRIGRLRQEAKPSVELVDELFRISREQFHCPDCGAASLDYEQVAGDDDEAWGQARRCDDCGAAIPRERVELFPATRLCVTCQARDERGEAPREVDYCPRCGAVMTLAQAGGAGLTRYRLICRACGQR